MFWLKIFQWVLCWVFDVLDKLLWPVKKLTNNKAASNAELATLKGTVGEIEESLSACTDDIVELKIKFEHLAAEFSK